MAISDETRADIQSLIDYSTTTMHQVGDMGHTWAGAFSRSSSATAGMSGVTEAVRFGQKLGGTMQAFSDFMSDAFKGATYLSYGALTIADRYATADMTMMQEMTTVADAFMPTPDRSASAEAAQSEFASQREAYFHPQKKSDGSPQLPPDEQKYETPSHMTPDEAASDHGKKYGQSETWHPVDPNAPVEPGPSYEGVPGL